MLGKSLLGGCLLIVAAHTSGCATIVARGPDEVPVDSNPSGAAVYLNEVSVGTTPTIVYVERGSPAVFRFELDGFLPETVEVGKTFNFWFLGNLALGGILGMIIDWATGNVTKYPESPVVANLRPGGTEPPAD